MAAITYAARGYTPRNRPLSGAFAAFDGWRRARAAEAQLAKLPDYLLNDLGLTRNEISGAVRNGRR